MLRQCACHAGSGCSAHVPCSPTLAAFIPTRFALRSVTQRCSSPLRHLSSSPSTPTSCTRSPLQRSPTCLAPLKLFGAHFSRRAAMRAAPPQLGTRLRIFRVTRALRRGWDPCACRSRRTATLTSRAWTCGLAVATAAAARSTSLSGALATPRLAGAHVWLASCLCLLAVLSESARVSCVPICKPSFEELSCALLDHVDLRCCLAAAGI